MVEEYLENMLSRWAVFFESDGEKEWWNREGELGKQNLSSTELKAKWELYWKDAFK